MCIVPGVRGGLSSSFVEGMWVEPETITPWMKIFCLNIFASESDPPCLLFSDVFLKVRELFLKHKAAELDREMGKIRTQEEAGRHVRMLTTEIRSTLDRHTILNTTLVELAKTLILENCTIWMPNAEGDALELTHELERRLVQVFLVPPLFFPCVLIFPSGDWCREPPRI